MDQHATKITVEHSNPEPEEKQSALELLIKEIRSPLSGIQSISAILLDKKRMSQRELEMISVINSTSIHLLKMLDNQQKEKSKPEHEKLKRKTVNVRRLIEETVLMIELKASEKSQNIIIKNKKKIIAYLDNQKIQRVMSNLVDNAIKFSPNNSVIQISITPRKSKVIIAIDDQGEGISPELKDEIFDIDARQKRRGINNEGIQGLGLADSKVIVEAHGGKIWFENKKPGGTVFFVELPLLHL
jgi:K+-sensing histidine kinase KdpD